MPSAVIIAALQALTEWFKFLNTPEGQELSKTNRENTAKFMAFIERVASGEMMKP